MVIKEVTKQQKSRFLIIFFSLMEGSGSDENDFSGFGSRRPKNIGKDPDPMKMIPDLDPGGPKT
jgi:hypothetical protein